MDHPGWSDMEYRLQQQTLNNVLIFHKYALGLKSLFDLLDLSTILFFFIRKRRKMIADISFNYK